MVIQPNLNSRSAQVFIQNNVVRKKNFEYMLLNYPRVICFSCFSVLFFLRDFTFLFIFIVLFPTFFVCLKIDYWLQYHFEISSKRLDFCFTRQTYICNAGEGTKPKKILSDLVFFLLFGEYFLLRMFLIAICQST